MSFIYEPTQDNMRPQEHKFSSFLFLLFQELQEEGYVLRVGGQSERWVLIQHAEPWLLSVSSKQRPQSRCTSEGPFLENSHKIPFMRKRSRRGVRDETTEPPAKKSAVDGREGCGEGLETSSSNTTTETLCEEEQQNEQANKEHEDYLVNVEVERGTPQLKEEEDTGQETMKTEDRRKETRHLRARKSSSDQESEEKPCWAGSANLDDE